MRLRLREVREQRGLTARVLADRAGVSFVTISRIENGHMSPTVDMVEKLAKALRVHISELFPPAPRRSRRK
jgi:transcriptional regulator with XRE-family HTH domain